MTRIYVSYLSIVASFIDRMSLRNICNCSLLFPCPGDAALTGNFGAAVLWNVQGDCDNYMVLKGHRNAVLDLCWTTDGQHIVSASPDKTVRAWDAVTGKQVCL